jgi:hypothetical protein
VQKHAAIIAIPPDEILLKYTTLNVAAEASILAIDSASMM